MAVRRFFDNRFRGQQWIYGTKGRRHRHTEASLTVRILKYRQAEEQKIENNKISIHAEVMLKLEGK